VTTEYVEPVPDYATEAGPTPRHEPEPEVVVPVRIVEGDARNEIRRHQYRAVVVTAADAAAGRVINVIGKRDLRARLEIVNTHAADPVFLLDNQTDSSWQGYRLNGGQKTELLHSEGPVFAILPSAAANDVLLSVVDEYSVMEQDED
jgi:hypothetical protein